MSFSQIRGQDRALRRLKGLLKTGRIPTALLLHGPEGVGKRAAAIEFAKSLVCKAGGPEACGECGSCTSVEKGLSPDVRVVDATYQAHLLEKEPEKALEKQKEWQVDTIREICHEMQRRSFEGGWKVAILDDAHRMNVQAQNALLKMLEEPPAKTAWVLVSHEPGRFLPTVISRTQPVAFGPLPSAVIEERLLALGVPADEAAGLSSAGSVRTALREREAREAFGGMAGPLAPLRAADSLPRELVQARNKAELALDHLSARLRSRWTADPAGAAAGLREMEKLRRLLRNYASPALVMQLAFLRTETRG